MMSKFRLKRTRQCSKCPWRKTTDPRQIPDGYSVDKHKALAETIADTRNPVASILGGKNMSCHEHDGDEGVHCIGWLYNQLGEGNNIGLRLRMQRCSNIQDIKLRGKQHATFADTLPKG